MTSYTDLFALQKNNRMKNAVLWLVCAFSGTLIGLNAGRLPAVRNTAAFVLGLAALSFSLTLLGKQKGKRS